MSAGIHDHESDANQKGQTEKRDPRVDVRGRGVQLELDEPTARPRRLRKVRVGAGRTQPVRTS